MLAECYFDETALDAPAEWYAVGGGIFKADQAIRQAELWSAMLEKWKVPYFRMSECAHRNGAFKDFHPKDADAIAREAIAVIRATISSLIYVSLDISSYSALNTAVQDGNAYSFCAKSVVMAASSWLKCNPDIAGMHYYFESGAEGQGHAAILIGEMFEGAEMKAACRYLGSSFVPKLSSPTVQAADLIIWHVGKDIKRSFSGEPTRKDFAALKSGLPVYGGHWTADLLTILERQSLLLASERGLCAEQIPEIRRQLRGSPKPARSR